jgi:SAM-dependent methyltransferase
VSELDSTREHLIATYRKKAKHYDLTSRLYPAPGYPQRGQRLRAVRALGLQPGDTVIDMACGTGLNFPLIQAAIGPAGRILGVDLTDAMLGRARDRVEANGWGNVQLVQSDAVEFDFPPGVDDLKVPDQTPRWISQLGTGVVRPFAAIDEWVMRRPWAAIRAAMQAELTDVSWTELFFGTAFLVAGARRAASLRSPRSGQAAS